MKRKLDANDIPSPDVAEGAEKKDTEDVDFETLNLDPRLRQALIKEKFTKPTLVQAKAIPLALEGKDILGMGLSYCINTHECLCTDCNSSREDWLWQDCRLCPSDSPDHSSEESRAYHHSIPNRSRLIYTDTHFNRMTRH